MKTAALLFFSILFSLLSCPAVLGQTASQGAAVRLGREVANLRADLETLREEQKLLLNRLLELEHLIQQKDGQIQALQNLNAGLHQRLTAQEEQLKRQQQEMQQGLSALQENFNQKLKQFAEIVSQEIARAVNGSGRKTSAKEETAGEGGAYRTHEVRSGENLSVIAKQYGITIRELRQLNQLTNDRIRVGQKLKIPAAK